MGRSPGADASIEAGARALIRLLAVVFFLSGFAALLYQVAWQRLLTVHYSAVALRSRKRRTKR
jgi:hypothetical protein